MIESETARQVENTRSRTATANDTEYRERGQRGQREELFVDRRKMVHGKLHDDISMRQQILTTNIRQRSQHNSRTTPSALLATLTRLSYPYKKFLESRQSADASHARQLIATQLYDED